MNVSSREFNFPDLEFVTLLQNVAKTFAWYLISRRNSSSAKFKVFTVLSATLRN